MMLSSVGAIYDRMDDTVKALKNYREALFIQQKIGAVRFLANTLLNIGVIFKKQNNTDSALYYFLSALKIAEENKMTDHSVPSMYANTGAIMEIKGEYEKALSYYERGIKMAVDIKDDIGKVRNNQGLASYYFRKGNLEEAENFGSQSVSLAIQLSNPIRINESAGLMKKIYRQLGNYKGAFEMYELEMSALDSLKKKENQKAVIRHQLQTEFDVKQAVAKADQEKKDALTAAEIRQQKTINNAFIVGAVLLLLLAFFIYLNLRQSKRKNKIIAHQKEEVEHQKEQAEQQRNRAEQSEKFKQEFLANMSHEIRTPMNAVMGMTNLVLDSKITDKQKFYLEGIKKSSETLLHIINDILDLSKIEAGKMELEKIDFSLHETVEQVKQIMQHKAGEKGLELVVDISSKIPDVLLGDPVRLNQVLINLTGNAIKFTESGSVCLSISREGNSGAEHIIKFSVIDTGIGIPEDKLQAVFESFSQASSSDTRKYGGTGLGLTISKQLVELQGGKISVESKVGYGTTFSFTINLEEGSAEQMQKRIADEEQIHGELLDGLRILIADDNEYNCIVAQDTLELKSKVKVTSVSNGQAAVDALRENDFDLILMDVQMPVMNGFEATQFIRKNLPPPKNLTPVIALTASVLRTDLDKCKDAGMNGYIPKPFKAAQLIAGIAGVLKIETKSVKKKIITPTIKTPILTMITNLEYLKEFCEGNKDQMNKYIRMFVSSAPALIEKLNTAIGQNDYAEIATQIHGYKTKWIMMGMAESKELALRIENDCRKSSPDEKSILENIESLTGQIEKAIAELQED